MTPRTCEGCGQTTWLDGPVAFCHVCRASLYGGDESHQTDRLFVPAPAPMAGQLEAFNPDESE